MIEKIHFNPKKPENHNVYISNIKNKYAMVYDGNKWNLKNQDETIGDLIVKSSRLKPIFSSAKEFSTMVDEFPILFVIAALTPGNSIFKGLEDLKNKESDRINEMKIIIQTLGIFFEYKKSTVKIKGTKKKDYIDKTLKVPNLKIYFLILM